MNSKHDRIVLIPHKDIYPNPNQPRHFFDSGEMKNLVDSLKCHGQLDPLLVTPCNDRYMIVAGERRWRAAATAGLTKLKCIVRQMDSCTVQEISLFENIQRENLHSLEEGRAFHRLVIEHGHTESTVAKQAGKSLAYVRARLALCDLDTAVDLMPQTRHLSLAQLTAIAKLKKGRLQIAALVHVFNNGLTSKQAERYCQKLKGEPASLLGLVSSYTAPHSIKPLNRAQTWALRGGEVYRLLLNDPMSVPTSLIDSLVAVTRKVLRAAEAIQSRRGESK